MMKWNLVLVIVSFFLLFFVHALKRNSFWLETKFIQRMFVFAGIHGEAGVKTLKV